MTLRERNRAETWVAIHNAAAVLALEHGWTGTTVEKIATRAGVSNRTFFNYFSSKEDAILGARDASIPEQALEEFHASHEDLIHRTVKLTVAIMRASYPNTDGVTRRRELIKQIPELGTRMKRLATNVEQLVEPIIQAEVERIAGETSVHTNATSEEAAHALTLYAATIIRFAFSKNPTALSEPGSDTVTAAITTFREVIQTSIWLN